MVAKAAKKKATTRAKRDSLAYVGLVNQGLAKLLVPVDSLVEDPANARLHPVRNLDAIRYSLAEFGQQKPIVYEPKSRRVLAGNGTLAAARALGWTHLAALPIDAADPTKQAGFALADNRSAELAEWDWPVLVDSVRALAGAGLDVEALGWSESELLAPPAEPETSGGGGGDSPEPAPEGHPYTVTFSPEAWETVERAIAKVREIADDPAVMPARALELMCADYLAGT